MIENRKLQMSQRRGKNVPQSPMTRFPVVSTIEAHIFQFDMVPPSPYLTLAPILLEFLSGKYDGLVQKKPPSPPDCERLGMEGRHRRPIIK